MNDLRGFASRQSFALFQSEDDGMVAVGVDEHLAQFVFDLFGFRDAANLAVEVGQFQLVA